jgi:hypothetical protein
MKKIKLIAIIILVTTLLSACGAAKSPHDVLISELNRIYSSTKQEHMYALHLELQFNSEASVNSDFMQAWLSIMPDDIFKADGALTLHLGPDEFRLFGSIATMDDFGENLREYNNGNIDFGVNIYAHKDEGVFYRDRQFYNINRNLGLDYGEGYESNEFIPIGDTVLARELITLLNNYANINQHDSFWGGIVAVTQTTSEEGSAIINADLDALDVYNYSQKSTSNWTNTARLFVESTKWNLKYALPKTERLDSTGIYIDYIANQGSNRIIDVMPHFSAIITRFAFNLSDDFKIDPR